MKKILLFMAAALTVATIASCSKDDDKDDNKKPDDTEKPDPKPDPVEEDLITIDGKFDDWAKITDAATASRASENIGWMQTDNQRIDALKTLKVTADGSYIYLYVECDLTVEYQGGTSWDGSELGKAFAGPIDIYIDADGNETTGGIYWTWVPIGWEYMIEAAGAFSTEGPIADAGTFQFTGEDQTDIWAVNPPAREDISRDGLFNGISVKDGDTMKVEISIVRAFLPKITGNKINIGVLAQSTNWTLHGLLPQIAQTTQSLGDGTCGTLAVTLPAAD